MGERRVSLNERIEAVYDEARKVAGPYGECPQWPTMPPDMVLDFLDEIHAMLWKLTKR